MNETASIPTKSITKGQLAEKYNVSANTLRTWIHNNPAMLTELAETGYDKLQKVFTPRQVEIIYRHIERP